MTCIEKLKELHPEWTTRDIMDRVDRTCPSDHMDIDDPYNCYAPSGCRACWEREYDGPVPHECECMGFTTKMHVKIMEKFEHHYTHRIIYKVRVQNSMGEVDDQFLSKFELEKLLEARIDG